jgi:hypothetical protein
LTSSREIGGSRRTCCRSSQSRAREADCRAIDLDSGVGRADAHRFYMREGMPITSFHFARALA